VDNEAFEMTLRETFGAQTFTSSDVINRVPYAKLPELLQYRVDRLARVGLGSPTKSAGRILHLLPGVEAVSDSRDGTIWRMSGAPDSRSL